MKRFPNDRNVCPGGGRHCDTARPGCEQGETYARPGVMPEGRGPGGPCLPLDMPGQFRHFDRAAREPFPEAHGHGPHAPCRPQDGFGPQRGPAPRRPHGRLTESPRYAAEDTNGKLLTLLRVLGHMGHRMDAGGGQGRILALIRENGEMTQRALTEQLGIQPGSVSEILGKLERAGLLVRTPNPTDRRTADVSLTEAGEIRAGEAEEKTKARREEMLSALTEEEKNTLLPLLEKLCISWEEKRPEHGPRHG